MEDKFILDLTNDEILAEMYQVIGTKEPLADRNTIGYITENQSEYYKNGVVDEDQLKKIYNRKGKIMNKYILALAINSLRNRPKDLFETIMNLGEGNHVLDYGCGTGTHGIACAQLGCIVHIMDISKIMLNISAARFKRRNLRYYYHDNDITIPENEFDFIICTDVVEHVPRPDRMLRNFIKFLKKGGIAHIHVDFHVNYNRGHLEQATRIWKDKCQYILNKHFIKISENNYSLISK